jgi:hypothetical protein
MQGGESYRLQLFDSTCCLVWMQCQTPSNVSNSFKTLASDRVFVGM